MSAKALLQPLLSSSHSRSQLFGLAKYMLDSPIVFPTADSQTSPSHSCQFGFQNIWQLELFSCEYVPSLDTRRRNRTRHLDHRKNLDSFNLPYNPLFPPVIPGPARRVSLVGRDVKTFSLQVFHSSSSLRQAMGRSGYDVTGTAPGTPAADAAGRARHRRPGGATPRATTPTNQAPPAGEDPERTPRARQNNAPFAPRMVVDGGAGQSGLQAQSFQGTNDRAWMAALWYWFGS